MYGIKGKYGILCWAANRGMNFYPLIMDKNNFYPLSKYNNPVIKESPMEIDNLLQQLMSDSDDYSMSVFKFTEEQEAEYIIKKLKGW